MAPTGNSEVDGFQRLFAKELTARREAEGLSRVKLAELLGCTRQWLDKIETLERMPSEALADDLDVYFKTGGTFRRIRNELEEARKLALIPTGFRPVIDIERESRRIRLYEPVMIPGLFQTEEYARAVFAAGHPPHIVEEQVDLRTARQDLLEQEDPPWVFLLLRENVLRDVPRHLRPEQCKRLLEKSELFNVSIQILPLGAPIFEDGTFRLMATDSHEVAFAESVNGSGQVFREPGALSAFVLCFERARSAALSVEESKLLIRKIMEDA